MFTIYMRRNGCDDFWEFKTMEELNEWLGRQMAINPDAVIVKIVETPIQ